MARKTSKKDETKSLLRRYHLAPKKSLGQNFLVDESIFNRILSAAELREEERVLEIGAGLGALTSRLAKYAKELIAVERDDGLYDYLQEVFAESANVRFKHSDALVLDIEKLAEGGKLVVVANLPYNIATPLIGRMLEYRQSISRMVLMVQKEVGERILAKAGTKDYGPLSITCRLYAEPSLVTFVGPDAFHPKPRVDSAVIRFRMRSEPLEDVGDDDLFKALIRGCFRQRRKTLRNNLRSLGIESDDVEGLARKVGLDFGLRPEALTIGDYATINRSICENEKSLALWSEALALYLRKKGQNRSGEDLRRHKRPKSKSTMGRR